MALKRDEVVNHLPAMRRYARALTRSDDMADDLVHDALVRAYDGAATFRADHALRGWLLAIVRNSFVSSIRRARSEASRDASYSEIAQDRADGGQEQAAYLAQIARRFDALPEQQRTVLHLISVEGLNYQEAAAVLGVPIGTVMSRLSRARAALRSMEEQAEHQAVRSLKVVGGTDGH